MHHDGVVVHYIVAPYIVIDLFLAQNFIGVIEKIFDEQALFAGQGDLRAVFEQAHIVTDIAAGPQGEAVLSLPAGQRQASAAGF